MNRPEYLTWLKDTLTKKHGAKGNLIYEEVFQSLKIPRFLEDVDANERPSRAFGVSKHLIGLVYDTFDRDLHILRKPFELSHEHTVYVGIDTHPRTEQALTFMAVDRRERYFVFKEVFKHGSPEDALDWMISFHLNIHKIYYAEIEPGSKGDANRGDSTFDIIDRGLAKYDIGLETGSKDLSSGILKVKEALLSKNGIPSLFVSPECPRTIKEFMSYVWDEYSDKTQQVKQTPKGNDSHMLENIRRLLLLPAEWHEAGGLRRMVAEANKGPDPLDAEAGY